MTLVGTALLPARSVGATTGGREGAAAIRIAARDTDGGLRRHPRSRIGGATPCRGHVARGVGGAVIHAGDRDHGRGFVDLDGVGDRALIVRHIFTGGAQGQRAFAAAAGEAGGAVGGVDNRTGEDPVPVDGDIAVVPPRRIGGGALAGIGGGGGRVHPHLVGRRAHIARQIFAGGAEVDRAGAAAHAARRAVGRVNARGRPWCRRVRPIPGHGDIRVIPTRRGGERRLGRIGHGRGGVGGEGNTVVCAGAGEVGDANRIGGDTGGNGGNNGATAGYPVDTDGIDAWPAADCDGGVSSVGCAAQRDIRRCKIGDRSGKGGGELDGRRGRRVGLPCRLVDSDAGRGNNHQVVPTGRNGRDARQPSGHVRPALVIVRPGDNGAVAFDRHTVAVPGGNGDDMTGVRIL